MNFTKNIAFTFSLILFLNFSLRANEIEYLILTPSQFKESAEKLAKLHSEDIKTNLQIKTEVIITKNEITAQEIRTIVQQKIQTNSQLNYLLLIGDNNSLPPIYKDNGPSDDFYSTAQESEGAPTLSTGRLPISYENDAIVIVNKIIEYSLNPKPGIWQSKVALIADDQFKNGTYKKT